MSSTTRNSNNIFYYWLAFSSSACAKPIAAFAATAGYSSSWSSKTELCSSLSSSSASPSSCSSAAAAIGTAGKTTETATEATPATATARIIPLSLQSIFKEDEIPTLIHTIQSGRVFVKDNFLTQSQIEWLLQDLEHQLVQAKFAQSGLSNTLKGSSQQQQGFTQQDRAVCPVPWWKQSLSNSNKVESFDNNQSINPVSNLLQDLRHFLANVLDRPTMQDHYQQQQQQQQQQLEHECYYSLAKVNSKLARHMDERHEELKGPKGWLLPSRRSLSWLVYLSDEDWTLEQNGGALRTFPQRNAVIAPTNNRFITTSHDTNLQVGWLVPLSLLSDDGNGNNDKTESSCTASVPVFLDAWYLPPSPAAGTKGKTPSSLQDKKNTVVMPDYQQVLYTIDDANNGNDKDQPQLQRKLVTKPWMPEALVGISLAEFLSALAQRDATDEKETTSETLFFTSRELAQQFHLLEDRATWTNVNGDEDDDSDYDNANGCGGVAGCDAFVDIAPTRGTLVIFDSVLVPHQVQVVKQGTRRALAGWFHEVTQTMPTTNKYDN